MKNLLKILTAIAFLIMLYQGNNLSDEQIKQYREQAQIARDFKCSNLPEPKPLYCSERFIK